VKSSGLPSGTLFGRIIVGVVVIFILLPLVWLLYSSFLPKEVVFAPQGIPFGFTLDNYRNLPFDALIRPLLVSLGLSSLVAVMQLIFGLPAAYAIRSGVPLLGVYLLLLSIPAELLLVPIYGVLQSFGILNTPWALVLPFLANPFTVFLIYSGVVRLPWAYVEAAQLDGAGTWAILTKVVAPLVRPELTAAAVLAFAAHWNLVLYPRVVSNDERWWTVQVALTDLLRKNPNEWGLIGAAAMLSSLPILVLYLIFERRVTRTLEGGIK
jgi:multiple sugar transport system permease protein